MGVSPPSSASVQPTIKISTSIKPSKLNPNLDPTKAMAEFNAMKGTGEKLLTKWGATKMLSRKVDPPDHPGQATEIKTSYQSSLGTITTTEYLMGNGSEQGLSGTGISGYDIYIKQGKQGREVSFSSTNQSRGSLNDPLRPRFDDGKFFETIEAKKGEPGAVHVAHNVPADGSNNGRIENIMVAHSGD